MLRALSAALCGMLLMTVPAHSDEDPSGWGVYELRTYLCEPGKLDALHERFRNHTLRLFEKHGMVNVAYWNPTDGEGAKNTLVYLLFHDSREAAKTSWDAFRADPEWKRVAAESQEQHGKILAQPPEAVYMTFTDYSRMWGSTDPPPLGTRGPWFFPDRSKVHELRIYTAAEGKLDALHARFRNHTDRLFGKHGMHSYAYWQPMDEPRSENVMLYLLQHDSREAAKTSWDAFRADPEWKRVVRESEKTGQLLAKPPEAVFMKPTAFSPRR
jgi:hypothetical protein